MSIVATVEDEIVRVLAVYSSFRRAILGEFSRFLMTDKALRLGSKAELKTALDAYAVEATAKLLKKSGEMTEIVGTLLLKTALRPGDSEELTEEDYSLLDDFMDSSVSRMEKSIVDQIRSDVLQILETYQRFLIRVHLAAANSNMESAAFYERTKVLRNVDLYHRDALGRRRDSEQFVFTELRYCIYRWFNISMVYILSRLGETRARIDRPGTHLHNVVIDLEDFADMEAQVFHPNAKALLVP